MKVETVDIKNGDGLQAIHIPIDFKIDDDKVYIKKVGNALYIIPFHNPWQNVIDSLENFTADFMDDRNHQTQRAEQHLRC